MLAVGVFKPFFNAERNAGICTIETLCTIQAVPKMPLRGGLLIVAL
jgi:hypothetical protein